MAATGYIGELRKHVGTAPLIVAGVRAIITDDANRVLMQKRRDFDTWGLPAGAMELGESAWDALRREVLEETGLRVLAAHPIAHYSGPRYAVTYPHGDRAEPCILMFAVDRWDGELDSENEESAALCFFAPDDLPESVWPMHREAIDDFLAFDGTFILRQ